MSREFGIYPSNMVPRAWIGCRGIIEHTRLDIPCDRWSSEFNYPELKQGLVDWVNEKALKELELQVSKHNYNGSFDSEDGKYRCEYKSNYGDYLYCGFYTNIIEED